LKAAQGCGKKVPEEIGIIGFSNEAFTEVTSPALSSVSQQSKKMGRETANVYFNHVLNHGTDDKTSHSLKLVIESSIIERESSVRKNKGKKVIRDNK